MFARLSVECPLPTAPVKPAVCCPAIILARAGNRPDLCGGFVAVGTPKVAIGPETIRLDMDSKSGIGNMLPRHG